MVMSSNMIFFLFSNFFLYMDPATFNKLVIPVMAPIKYCLETTNFNIVQKLQNQRKKLNKKRRNKAAF